MSSRTSKSLAERIDINYWKEPHPDRRWKRYASLGAGGVALLWLAWNGATANQRVFQAGPVAPVHQMFESECSRCHTESWQPVFRLLGGGRDRRSAPDTACLKCHDGPIHHDQQIESDVPHCAECHAEHRGATALTRVSDHRCVACHAALKSKSQSPQSERSVSSFVSGHPEIGVLRRHEADRGTIKLNHAKHLNPDGILTTSGAVERLTCANCHEPDSDRRLMRPIDHETHCARCHANALLFDSLQFPDRPAPHRDPETVRAVLRERYSELVRQHPERVSADASNGVRRVPGRSPVRGMSQAEADWVLDRLDAAERVLFDGAGGCRFCHEVSRVEGAWEVAKVNIPMRWLEHSAFRHDSHRMLTCAACHAAASSTSTADVLLPNIDSCRSCHGKSGGAQADCAECHTYHDKSRERSFDGSMSLDHK